MFITLKTESFTFDPMTENIYIRHKITINFLKEIFLLVEFLAHNSLTIDIW